MWVNLAVFLTLVVEMSMSSGIGSGAMTAARLCRTSTRSLLYLWDNWSVIANTQSVRKSFTPQSHSIQSQTHSIAIIWLDPISDNRSRGHHWQNAVAWDEQSTSGRAFMGKIINVRVLRITHHTTLSLVIFLLQLATWLPKKKFFLKKGELAVF